MGQSESGMTGEFSGMSSCGKRRRAMMLLFQGEDAVRKVRSVVGNITAERSSGETIRGTFGDLILDDHGSVRYFEPAVLAPPNVQEAQLKAKGLTFNTPDVKSFRDALSKAGFYAEWRGKFGEEAMGKLEKYSGKLV